MNTQTPRAPEQPGGTWYEKPKKKHTVRNVVIGIVGVFAALTVIGSFIGEDTGSIPKPSITATTEPSTAPAPAVTAPEPTTAAPIPAALRWVTIKTFKGSSDKRSTPFHLTGNQARLIYSFTDTSGIGAIVGSIYIVEKGHSLQEEGGFPEVMVSEPGKDSTELAQGEGDYYLDVSAANARWTVTVQEKR